MYVNQAIPRPSGLTVVGTCLVRAEPDRALLGFRVSRTAKSAASAFAGTREAAARVRKALADAHVPSDAVRTSNITLQTKTSGAGPNEKVVGQVATIAFAVELAELATFEKVLVDIIDAGAHQIDRITFHTSRLAEVREMARRRAVAAARAKAALYADAAEVELGGVLHIEDLDPSSLSTSAGHGEDVVLTVADDDAAAGPGAITVAAAVAMDFAILESEGS